MYHLYIVEMEAKIRRVDAQREAQRIERIRVAQANGSYESVGWLTLLARRMSRLPRRVYRQKQRVAVSQVSVSPC